MLGGTVGSCSPQWNVETFDDDCRRRRRSPPLGHSSHWESLLDSDGSLIFSVNAILPDLLFLRTTRPHTSSHSFEHFYKLEAESAK